MNRPSFLFLQPRCPLCFSQFRVEASDPEVNRRVIWPLCINLRNLWLAFPQRIVLNRRLRRFAQRGQGPQPNTSYASRQSAVPMSAGASGEIARTALTHQRRPAMPVGNVVQQPSVGLAPTEATTDELPPTIPAKAASVGLASGKPDGEHRGGARFGS